MVGIWRPSPTTREHGTGEDAASAAHAGSEDAARRSRAASSGSHRSMPRALPSSRMECYWISTSGE